jgi:hypothetical protein
MDGGLGWMKTMIMEYLHGFVDVGGQDSDGVHVLGLGERFCGWWK